MDNVLPRVLVVWGTVPSKILSGNVLRNLLADYPRDRVTVVASSRVLDSLSRRHDHVGLLDARHIGVRPWASPVRGLRRVLRSLNLLKIPPLALLLSRRATPDTVILTLPWGGEFGSEMFVAAYLAHRISGAPLIVYEMDEWRASLGPRSGAAARLLERAFHGRILRAASTVWVISEQLGQNLRKRFGVEPRLMPHSVDLDSFCRSRRGQCASRRELRLFYTGSVYGPQAGAIRNVLRAIQATPGLRWSLSIYSSQSSDELAGQGIAGPGLHLHAPAPVEAIPGLLASADALLLPFSFDAGQRDVVSTSLPTKVADYLASGTPILVHAPPHATITRLAHDEGWALVVDEPCQDRLAAGLSQLAADDRLRARLVARALGAAAARHHLAANRRRFIASIQAAIDPGRAAAKEPPAPGDVHSSCIAGSASQDCRSAAPS